MFWTKRYQFGPLYPTEVRVMLHLLVLCSTLRLIAWHYSVRRVTNDQKRSAAFCFGLSSHSPGRLASLYFGPSR